MTMFSTSPVGVRMTPNHVRTEAGMWQPLDPDTQHPLAVGQALCQGALHESSWPISQPEAGRTLMAHCTDAEAEARRG